MTTLPNREVGDDGHVDDHNNIAAAIASLEAALPVAQNAAASASAAAASAASALSSKTSAESAQSAAESAAANSLTYSQQASASAAGISVSEANASSSAANAAVYEVAAEAAKTSAEAAQSAAEAAQTGAESAESNAASSSSTATTQAGIATTKAGEAAASAVSAGSAQSAAESAQSAAESASSSASASASAASSSESAAESSASAAAVSASAAAGSASAAATSAASIDSYASLPVEFRQFAADGSVLANLPARVHPAEQLLKQAVWWIDAAHSSASGQSVSNLGWGGSALDAQVGSSGSADSNDPKYLDWQGENYVYLPGVSGNYLSVPDEAALDITGDIDIRVRVAADDWINGAHQQLIMKGSTSSAAAFAYSLRINTTGCLVFECSDGSSFINNVSSTTPLSFADGDAGWVRATFDLDNGSNAVATYYYAADQVDVPTSWTTLDSKTRTTVSAINDASGGLTVGAELAGSTRLTAGSFYRAQICNGINGTPVLDVDFSQIASGADTSFTALTGQTVTINRSTSGRKTVGVVHPRWLFGTDDYMEVADHPLLNFGADDSFTVLGVIRNWTTNAEQPVISKRNRGSASSAAYSLNTNSSGSPSIVLFDLANNPQPSVSALPTALTVATGVRNAASRRLSIAANGSTAEATDTTGSLVNPNPVQVGRYFGNDTRYASYEFIAAAIWRRALTSGEIATLTSYFQGRA